MDNFLLVFICHDIDISINLQNTYDKSYIMLVGKFNNDVHITCQQYPRIIVAEKLPMNIEDEKKLLTFTAWYAIVKNKLFTDYEYLCLLEYDVEIDKNFLNDLKFFCRSRINYNVISFLKTNYNFLTDVNSNILLRYTSSKMDEKSKWYCTTNYCIRYDVLEKFVNYYANICFDIKRDDYEKLSWYHERIFYLFVKDNNMKTIHVKGLTHFQKNSHGANINKKIE